MKKSKKGFAHMKDTAIFKIVYGNSEQAILKTLQNWNKNRTLEQQFIFCNIGTLDTETDKYTGYQKYEVATGKNLTSLWRKKQMEHRDEKKTGVPETDSLQKAEYGVRLENEGKEKEYSPELVKVFQKVVQIDLKEMDIAREKLLLLQELVKTDLELNQSVSEMTKQILDVYGAEICSLDTGKGSPWVAYRQTEITAPGKENKNQEDTVQSNFENRIWEYPEEAVSYEVGDSIAAYVPKWKCVENAGDVNFYISGISKIKGTVESIETGAVEGTVYCVKEEQGLYSYVRQQEVYSNRQAEVLKRAVEDRLPLDKFHLLANPELGSAQMEEMRLALKESQMQRKQQYTRELTNHGFQANDGLIKQLENIDFLTGRSNTLKDICIAFKEGSYEQTPAGEAIQSFGRQLQYQEQHLQAAMEPEL